jgi:hypothetical protein
MFHVAIAELPRRLGDEHPCLELPAVAAGAFLIHYLFFIFA